MRHVDVYKLCGRGCVDRRLVSDYPVSPGGNYVQQLGMSTIDSRFYERGSQGRIMVSDYGDDMVSTLSVVINSFPSREVQGR